MSGPYVSRVLGSDLPMHLLKTAAALASFADENGERIQPSMPELARVTKQSVRTVQNHMAFFRDMEILVEADAATQHRPATYRMDLDKLPPPRFGRSPEVQLVAPLNLPEVQPVAPLESPEVQPVAPLAVPSTEYVRTSSSTDYIRTNEKITNTHTPRGREGRIDRIQQVVAAPDEPLEPGRLPLVGAVPPPRCAHPYAHAWCDGRVHVPKGLHFEFLDQLDTRPGESKEDKAGRLIAFYASVNAALPPDQPIGENPFKFWRTRFEVAFASPPAPRHTARDIARHLPPASMSSEDLATMSGLRAGREAAEAAATEAAERAYNELTANERAELEREALKDLKDYRTNLWTVDAFAQSVRHRVIQILKSDAGRQQLNQRKQG